MSLDAYFRVLRSESVLDEVNEYFDVIKYRVEFPMTGVPGRDFFTVNHKFFACAAVCRNEDHQVLLVRVPRFSLRDTPDEFLWELPGGRNRDGEDPGACIRREIQEETGAVVGVLRQFSNYFYPESSFGTEKLYLYEAAQLQGPGTDTPEDEGPFETNWFSLDDALAMIESGAIRSSWTIIGLLLAKLRRGTTEDSV